MTITQKAVLIFFAVVAPIGARAEAIAKRSDLTRTEQTRVDDVTRPATDFSRSEPYEAMQGGAGTMTGKIDRHAFMKPLANLSDEARESFFLGKAIFEKFWVSSPSSTQASDGLGPLYNARSCHSCHLRNGRGQPPHDGDATSFVLRLAIPPHDRGEREKGLNFPDPIYGAQIQDLAVGGLNAEGQVLVKYNDVNVVLDDGTSVTLRQPAYSVAKLNYGPLSPETTLSPRIAQPLMGMGLIEAIAPTDILSGADPDDADGDGISGRPAWIDEGGKQKLGLFGWKAQHATVRSQAAAALNTDIGISSPDQPGAHGDCTSAQEECLDLPDGVQPRLGQTEAPDPVMDILTAYTSLLAVPARRNVSDRQVLRGKQQFYQAGCAACHRPKFVTRRDAADNARAFQLIWPYSDFLLHDLGAGLADGQQVGEADGREWRTPPLWAIGLSGVVNGRNFYLHDGRARTLEEAILWHGGEAEASKNVYMSMEKTNREALIRFLESL